MPLIDLLRKEYLRGTVLDKYQLENGNVCLVLENGTKRYHVEFRDNYTVPCLENLFGLFTNPFDGQTQQLDRLIREGDYIELSTSYSRTPFREAYLVHSVSRAKEGISRVVPLQYRSHRV